MILWFKWFFSTQLKPTGILIKEPSPSLTSGWAMLGNVFHTYTCKECKQTFWSRKRHNICNRWGCYKHEANTKR